MRKDEQKLHQGGAMPRSGRTNGLIPSSFRALSSYLRVVSSGASTVARSAASVASSILDRDSDADHDQVIWAGFDKAEVEGGVIWQVLLLGYRTGFQVWDVEDSKNVQDIASRHDGPVSFMQMLSKPIASKRSEDKFADSRPLLVVCTDGIYAGGGNNKNGFTSPCNGSTLNCHDQVNGIYLPTTVQFYSLKSQSYVHVLKLRSAIYSVRCSSRVVAVAQSTQIHCFSATTLEREYTLLINPIVMSCPVSGGIGYGPLSVGPRWLAYSGSPVVVSNCGRVNPQHVAPSASFPGFSSNGSLVAHYATESSKQLAAGIVTLGDIGYKKLSRYCSELRPDGNGSSPSVNSSWKGNGISNGHLGDSDNNGMVIVRDIVSKGVVAQFRAHKSPISALCFDPSGTILVTGSVQGHNFNVFKIIPGRSDNLASEGCPTHVHLYRLQRGVTNAVIQDISFSDDSNWIMISSSRGTSHLFAINPLGGSVNIQSYDASLSSKNGGMGVMTDSAVHWPSNSSSQIPKQQSLCVAGPPIALSVVCRIRNGNNGWRGLSGAAAAAAGRTSFQSGVIASSFCNGKGSASYVDGNRFKTKYHLLVFSSAGSMIQYALGTSMGQDLVVSGLTTQAHESALEADSRLVVEAIQKWNICQKQSRRDREDNVDIYGENGTSDSNKIYPVEMKDENIDNSKLKDVTMKVNYHLKEENHLYFSEAELQIHQAQTPVWAKREICFHSMVNEEVLLSEETASEGEIEIEKFPTHVIEARAKNLIPIFDCLQPQNFQQTRNSTVNGEVNEPQLHLNSGINGKDKVAERSNLDSADSDVEGSEWNDHLGSLENNGYVNKNDNETFEANTCHEVVNNREHSYMEEAQLMPVNSKKEGLKMENHLEEDDNVD